MKSGFFIAAAIAALSLWPAAAMSQGLADSYRGMFVCEQIRGSLDILHVPLDLAVHGSDAVFARPLFNLRGTRVVGSELGFGTVDPDGRLHLGSSWSFRGVAVKGEYSGNLGPTGGTFTGTQTWRGQGGITGSRTCVAALVPAPKAGEPTPQ